VEGVVPELLGEAARLSWMMTTICKTKTRPLADCSRVSSPGREGSMTSAGISMTWRAWRMSVHPLSVFHIVDELY
jgi:hypothetical protein